MSKNDEVESWKLQTVISDIEHRLFNRGASVGSSSSMLEAILDDAKKQLNSLDLKQKDHNEEERRKANAELATVVYLVAQETALNQRERQQYGAFIQKDFFTKNDFTALEDFYSNAWDRLTEEGKAQMSHRVWEGVRREEYTFNDLPDTVKQKEAQSVRDMFAGLRRLPPEMGNISQEDRSDFIGAWDAGQKDKAYAVLDRPAFVENVAVASRLIASKDAVSALLNDAEMIKVPVTTPSSSNEPPQVMGTLDLTNVNIQLGDPSSKSFPPTMLGELKSSIKTVATPGD